MSSNNSNINHIYNSSGCLKLNVLQNYITGKVNQKEKLLIEEHIANCQICADAVEGLKNISEPERLTVTINRINRKIENRIYQKNNLRFLKNNRILFRRESGIKVRKQAWIYFAAASVILFIVFLGYLNFHNTIQEESLAIIDDTLKNAPSEVLPLSEAEFENEEKSVIKKEKSEIKIIDKKEEGTEEKQNISRAKEKVTIDLELEEKEFIADEDEQIEGGIEVADIEVPAPKSQQQSVKTPYPAEGNNIQEKNITYSEILADEEIVEKGENEEDVMLAAKSGKSEKKISRSDKGKSEIAEYAVLANDKMPTFKGKGLDEFKLYIKKNLNYPDTEADMTGKVFIQFTVNTKGKVVDVKVVRSLEPLFDEEAVRVVKSSPKWEPGIQNGKPVDVKIIVPVIFNIE